MFIGLKKTIVPFMLLLLTANKVKREKSDVNIKKYIFTSHLTSHI